MKHILFVIAGLLLLSGCNESNTTQTEEINHNSLSSGVESWYGVTKESIICREGKLIWVVTIGSSYGISVTSEIIGEC